MDDKEVKEVNDVAKEKFSEEEFLKKVEDAASKGVSKAGFKNTLLGTLPTIILVVLLAVLIVPKINSLTDGFKNIFKVDAPVEGRDLTLENYGIFGYTAADFEKAILGDSSQLKKLEVYKQDVSDVATLTDTGLLNWSVFTKTKMITYNGTAVYTVDLTKLTKNDIKFNEEEKIITLTIPHAEQEEINIPEDKIDFADTEKGLLAFGDLNMTPEQIMKVQAEARNKMQEKLDASNILETADRFAKLSVWEIYSPIVKGVAKDYSLEVEFRD